MMEENKYGILINQDTKLHRQYFKEMCKLIGVNVIFRAPKPGKYYTTYTEIKANYENPEVVSCIFEEYPKQQTLKKLGWVAELDENASIIHVPYDLKGLQQGALFIIPSGLDNAEGRLFRVVKLTNSMIYPSSIACQIVPEYENTLNETVINNFEHTGFNLLNEEGN